MEHFDLFIIIFLIVFSAIGLVLTFLQKTWKIRPVITRTADSFHFTSGGSITIMGAIFGAIMIKKYSGILAVVYLAVIAAAYIVIQVIFRKKD